MIIERWKQQKQQTTMKAQEVKGSKKDRGSKGKAG